jgi:hypothetical protein
MTPQQIKDNAPQGATHYATDDEGWFTYLRAESWGYVCPYSGLKISEYDLHALEIKPL